MENVDCLVVGETVVVVVDDDGVVVCESDGNVGFK